jgi:hypothetical protein
VRSRIQVGNFFFNKKRFRLLFLSLIILFLITIHTSALTEISLPYTQKYSLNYNSIEFFVNQENAPLYIEFRAYPQMVSDNKMVFSSPKDMSGTSIRINRPNEFSEFKITIKNQKTGEILLEEGYGKNFESSTSQKKFVIREKGPYLFEISGQKINIDISINSPYKSITSVTPGTIETKNTINNSGNIQNSDNQKPDINKKINYPTIPIDILLSLIFILLVGYMGWKLWNLSPNPHQQPPKKVIPPVSIIPNVKRSSVRTIKKKQSPLPPPDPNKLINDLKTGKSLTRGTAACKLAENGKDSINPLVQLLKDSNPDVRKFSALALGKIGSTSAREALTDSLKDSDEDIRFWAQNALNHLN